MKNLYFLDEEEKKRILNLHEESTKRQYLTLEQTLQQSGSGVSTNTTKTPTSFLNGNLSNHFKFGEYESDSAKKDILAIKPKIEEFIRKSGGKQFVVNISAGESNVTNPKGFETKGSLALARANSVKQYFQEIFPDLIKNGSLVIKSPNDVSQVVIGKTPYDKTKGDNKNPQLIKKYQAEQFVTFDVQGSGDVENIQSICNWTATTTGMTADVSTNFISNEVKLVGTGELTLNSGSIPDRLIVVDQNNRIKQDTGYIATKAHQYSSFKYVPLYVSKLTQLNKTASVSGAKIITIKVSSIEDLMKQILVPGVPKIPEDKTLRDMGQTEVYNGIEELRALYGKGVREFVVYEISSKETITIPYDNKTGDYKLIVYSPVGKTNYGLSGKC